MNPKVKALIYVLLAMLAPLGELLAVAAKNHVWPDVYELAACGCSALMSGLVTLKAWGSDPATGPKAEVRGPVSTT